MQRITVYVDGFNFYYGLRRMKTIDPDWKQFYWIDFVKLFDHFKEKGQVLQKVIYFTTPHINIQKSARQDILLKTNKLLNNNRFEVIFGKFYHKQQTCKICKAKYRTPEEKRTDVNISVQMMRDCALDNTDILILVTADSDLAPPIESIKADYPNKIIKIIFPPKAFSNDLNNFMKDNKRKVLKLEKHKRRFLNSRMPDTVTKDGITYTIPLKWKIILTLMQGAAEI